MRYMILISVVLLLASVGWAAVPIDCSLVPGWTQRGEAREFVPDNLFDYMDGGAEGYLVYEFVHLNGITCESGEDRIIIDISETASPEFAYGLFASNRDPREESEAIGTVGQVTRRRSIFSKDKYFVEMSASPSKDHGPAMRAFMAAIEKLIPGSTDLPAAVGWFPTDKLVDNSVRMVPQSVLGISALRTGYVAEYEFGKAFVVPEESPEAASALLKRMQERFEGATAVKISDEAFQATDRYLGGVCFFRKGNYIAGYNNLSEGQNVEALGSALAAKLP